MIRKLNVLILLIFCFVLMGVNADAQDQIQYDVYQHKNFSVEYPHWGIKKKTDKGRLLLKVAKGLAAIQVELHKGSLDTIYDYHVTGAKKSNAFISENANEYLLVHTAQALWIKLFMHRKFFESGGNTYVVTFASTRGNAEKYKEMREYVFNSVEVKETEGYKDVKSFTLNTDKEYPFGIYLTDSDGSYLKKIYKSRYLIRTIRLSHDGKRIVFAECIGAKPEKGQSDEDLAVLVHAEICTINVDGTGYKVLTRNDYADVQPNWAQDNRHIFFTRDGSGRAGGFDLDIFVMDENGGNIRNITQSPGIIDGDPHVYGGKIAFTRHSPGKINQSVWIMNEDGSGMYKLLTPPRHGKSKVGLYFGDFDPNISFDSERVAFERLEDDNFKVFDSRVGKYSICITNIDGSGFKSISPNDVTDGLAQWLPNGRLVFPVVSDNLDAFRKLYIMDSDGANRHPLIRTKPGMFFHGRPSAAKTEDGGDIIVFAGWFY